MKISGLLLLGCWLLAASSLAQELLPDGYQYLFPGPGAKYLHPGSTIILRFQGVSPDELSNIETLIKVFGVQSGIHSGKASVASDGRTLIFKPETDFLPGETVEVRIDPRFPAFPPDSIGPLLYKFTVREEAVSKFASSGSEGISIPEQNKGAYQAMILSNGVSVPADFPHVNVSINQNPSELYVFLNNWDAPNYNIIFNTSGEAVWYWKTPDRRDDFKVQSNGWITMYVEEGYGGSDPAFIALDQDFKFIKSMRATNGYTTDEHDFLLLPDSGYILIGYKETTVDMSQYVSGGKRDATVLETCIQEFSADDQLIFIWRAWDHFNITDLELESLTAPSIRFPHMNAIFMDDDGHILLSSRHLSEISKIHHRSGEFIWRLSGIPDSPNNDFKFVRDPLNGFRNQHAIRSLGNNTYELFDNGNMHAPPLSRVVEYEIDTVHKTATLIWEHRSGYERGFVSHMGNSQRLPNGNTHVNWAYGNALPIATEITPAGETVFEMWFEKGDRTYRSFRHPWIGISQEPYLLLEPEADNLTLIFNKFGDQNVDHYRIYGGPSPHPTSLIDISHTTIKYLEGLENGVHYYFRVTAVDHQGTESGFSNEEDVVLRSFEPGTNLLVNGDFARALDSWEFRVDSMASADVQVTDSICHILIQNGGKSYPDVQIMQDDIPLFQGENYLFEFDAWADDPRIIDIIIGETDPPYGDFSRLGYTGLDPDRKHFTFSFEMMEPTNLNSCLRINSGSSAGNLYLDNISLKMEFPSGTGERDPGGSDFVLYPNYPNPFSSETHIEYDLPEASVVGYKIYNYLGQKVEDYIIGEQSRGRHSCEIQAGSFSSGIYYYAVEAKAVRTAKCYRKTDRMVLLK